MSSNTEPIPVLKIKVKSANLGNENNQHKYQETTEDEESITESGLALGQELPKDPSELDLPATRNPGPQLTRRAAWVG
jgi:hypothetical protein